MKCQFIYNNFLVIFKVTNNCTVDKFLRIQIMRFFLFDGTKTFKILIILVILIPNCVVNIRFKFKFYENIFELMNKDLYTF